jgi:hypothetical protein
VGAGMALNPMLLAAMSDVEPDQSGLASGLVNTSFMMGGALGLAVLASLAAARAHDASIGGQASFAALTDGYHVAFAVGAGFAIAAAVLGLKGPRMRTQPAAGSDEQFSTDAVATAAD